MATIVIFGFTRCARSTALVVACSLVAVVWQFGLLALHHTVGGDLWIPHCISVDGAIIRLFDEHVHERLDPDDTGATLTCIDVSLARELQLPEEGAMSGVAIGAMTAGAIETVLQWTSLFAVVLLIFRPGQGVPGPGRRPVGGGHPGVAGEPTPVAMRSRELASMAWVWAATGRWWARASTANWAPAGAPPGRLPRGRGRLRRHRGGKRGRQIHADEGAERGLSQRQL